MKKGRVNSRAKYTEEEIRTHRTFPTSNTILLIFLIVVQVALVILGIRYQPKPQDVIRAYDVTVWPQSDGSLDIEYHFVWEPLDPAEPLTWVQIGMANENFKVLSTSSNISIHTKQVEDGYVSLRLDFFREYTAGDVIDFSFTVNQKDMLCFRDAGYFYEFVPSWFNAIQVERYTFQWVNEYGQPTEWKGSLGYGEYCMMSMQYDRDDFAGCQTVEYEPFEEGGAYNELQEDKTVVLVLCCLGAALLIIVQVYIVDSYVSYGRGRGFLTGHGYHVHTYGRTNPYYIRARDRYNATHTGSHGGRSGGGGCACACACACAGGGRAGCSQKDTTRVLAGKEQ